MSTNLRIRDREYDLEATFSNAPLNVLIYMTKRLGVTMKDIVGGLEQMNEQLGDRAATDGDQTSDTAAMMDLLSDERALESFRGLIWLSRTYAGERTPDGRFFTLEEASDGIGFGDFDLVNPPDPTQLEVVQGTPVGPSTSTTSSETSPTTSSSSLMSGLVTHS